MSDIDYALMAGAAYYDTRAAKNRFAIPAGWSLYKRLPEKPSGFEASVFKSDAGNNYVISFAGTDPSSVGDLLADAGMGTGFGFPQKPNDLLFRVSLLHVQSPSTWDWTPKSRATQFRGDVV